MEFDLVTRVYGYNNTPQREEAVVLSPAYQAGERTYRGDEAKAIFDRADFRLVPYTANPGHGNKQGYHVYRAPFTPGSDSFNIDATNWRTPRDSAQGYQRLPQEIQRRANEKQPARGLTIVVPKK